MWSQSQSKNFMSLYLSRMNFSAVQNITQRPAKNPQHSTSKLTKFHDLKGRLILLLITIIMITAGIDP